MLTTISSSVAAIRSWPSSSCHGSATRSRSRYPCHDFLEDPTISRLARIVEQTLEHGTAPSAPPLVPVDRDAPLPASFAQQRLWFLDQLEPGRASYHIPAAVKLVGRLDIPSLERALNEVVRRHEVLRTTLVADGGIPRQVIAARLELPLTV